VNAVAVDYYAKLIWIQTIVVVVNLLGFYVLTCIPVIELMVSSLSQYMLTARRRTLDSGVMWFASVTACNSHTNINLVSSLKIVTGFLYARD